LYVQAEHKNNIMKKNIKYITVLFLLLVLNSCTCLKWHTKKPEGLIKPKKAKELHDNYVNNQYRFINGSVKNDSIIIGEETVFMKSKKAAANKKNGGGGLDHLEIEIDVINTPEYQDSYEAWFSIDELGSFLVSTKEKAKRQGLKNIGIRVYYASYIINKKLKTTVIFVPTHNIGGDENIDNPIFQINIEGYDCLNYGNTGQDNNPYSPNAG